MQAEGSIGYKSPDIHMVLAGAFLKLHFQVNSFKPMMNNSEKGSHVHHVDM